MYNGAGAAFIAAPGANDDACDRGWGADEEEKEVLLIERDGDGDGDEALPEPVPNPPVEPGPPPLVGADEPPPTADGGAAPAARPPARPPLRASAELAAKMSAASATLAEMCNARRGWTLLVVAMRVAFPVFRVAEVEEDRWQRRLKRLARCVCVLISIVVVYGRNCDRGNRAMVCNGWLR